MMTTVHSNGQANARGAENVGRWTAEEHNMFLKGVELHGKAWKKIAAMIATRTVVQVRTHAQKYFQKLVKANENGQALLPSSENNEPKLITSSIAQSPSRSYRLKAKETRKVIQKGKLSNITIVQTASVNPSTVAGERAPAMLETSSKYAVNNEKKRSSLTACLSQEESTAELKKLKYSSPAIQTQMHSPGLYLVEGSPTSVSDIEATQRLPLSLGEIAYSPFKFPNPSSSSSLEVGSLLEEDEDCGWLNNSFVVEEPQDPVMDFSKPEEDLKEMTASSTSEEGEKQGHDFWEEPFDSDSFLNSQDLVELNGPF